jgi:hypothetical protein
MKSSGTKERVVGHCTGIGWKGYPSEERVER